MTGSVPKSIRAFLQDQNFEERIPDFVGIRGKHGRLFRNDFSIGLMPFAH